MNITKRIPDNADGSKVLARKEEKNVKKQLIPEK